MWPLIRRGILSQCIHISYHHDVYFKYLTFLIIFDKGLDISFCTRSHKLYRRSWQWHFSLLDRWEPSVCLNLFNWKSQIQVWKTISEIYTVIIFTSTQTKRGHDVNCIREILQGNLTTSVLNFPQLEIHSHICGTMEVNYGEPAPWNKPGPRAWDLRLWDNMVLRTGTQALLEFGFLPMACVTLGEPFIKAEPSMLHL